MRNQSLCRAVCYSQPLQLQISSCYFIFYISQSVCYPQPLQLQISSCYFIFYISQSVCYPQPLQLQISSCYFSFTAAYEESLSRALYYPQSLKLNMESCDYVLSSVICLLTSFQLSSFIYLIIAASHIRSTNRIKNYLCKVKHNRGFINNFVKGHISCGCPLKKQNSLCFVMERLIH
jgi:hypothetical protein